MEDFKKFTLLDESQRSKIATDSTKMESTKEDKPDFEKMAMSYISTLKRHSPGPRISYIAGCEKILNDYVIPERKHNAEMQTMRIEWRDKAIDKINSLESENERLKSELDKAITYLSKTYRYLNADSVLREEIKDLLKDKR